MENFRTGGSRTGGVRSGPPGTDEEDPKAPFGGDQTRHGEVPGAGPRQQSLVRPSGRDRWGENWRLEKTSGGTGELPRFTYIRLRDNKALFSTLLVVDSMLAS